MPDKFDTQTNNETAWVGVRVGDHADTKETITEIIVEGKSGTGHVHLGFNEKGDEVFRKER